MEEIEVPIEQRYLIITGIVESSINKKSFGLTDSDIGVNSLCCFISFAYADLPIEKTFGVAFRRTKPEENIRTIVKIKAVTQQFGTELNSIPYGWKTVCILHFPSSIPEIIKNLPVIKDWYESEIENHICITNEKTLQTILVN